MSTNNSEGKLRQFIFRSFFLIYLIFELNHAALSFQTISEIDVNTSLLNSVKPDTIIIDVRNPIYYECGHIPKSINIFKNFIPKRLKKIIKNKKTPLIFYCSNRFCPDSEISAERAAKAGYVNILILKEGYTGWKNSGFLIEKGLTADYDTTVILKITPGELEKKTSDFYIVDLIGKPVETGKIQGAVIIPEDVFFEKFKIIPLEKNIVLYHISGEFSEIAAKFLISRKYNPKKIFFLES